MAKHNTHRAAGRAVTPAHATNRALRGAGGAAVLGSVLMGSAFAATSAQAAPAAPAPQTAQAAPSAPAAPAAPSVKISSGSTLYKGTRGERVEDLQKALNDHGASLEVDCKFGPRTHSAVLSFQRDNDLKVDGRVGPATRAALNGGEAPSSSGASKPSSSKSTSSILSAARSQIGTDYVSRGDSPGQGFDCSGLTQWAYAQAGIDIPRTSGAQASAGHYVSKSAAQPGDLVVWDGHVGIYAGGNKVVDAGNSKGSVSERTIWGSPSFVSYR